MSCGVCVLSKEYSEARSQFVGCQSSTVQDRLHAFTVLAQNRLQETNDYPVINLMHWIAHIHQIDTEIWNAPKCVEQKMCSSLLSLRLVVLRAWIHHKDSVDNYFDYLNYLNY